jgi:hypothetical protein
MSSFVINKSEYVKAAGLMYGIEASKRVNAHKWFLDHVRDNFVKCYELNVDSVNEQYGDESGKDGSDYDYEFTQYCKIGERIKCGLHEGMTFKELRINLMQFFRSVLYQIENEEMNQFVSAFFFECTSKLFSSELHAVEGWWGDIEL